MENHFKIVRVCMCVCAHVCMCVCVCVHVCVCACMRASVYVCMLSGMWKFCLRSQLCPRGIVSVLLPPTNSEQLGEGPV